ncbi:hypothetical protein [Leuconostoc falkenbergense]|uniref:hypothetical protein n=1 Tax=Leuconostoc falkenbergense TaxID=2766470 RepID=UPI00166459B7|nr:hypothetical protein [Leuconostoc falkenbergense]
MTVENYGYVYLESVDKSTEKAITLDNNSEYFDTQSGSPSIVTIIGPCSVNPSWKVIQAGAIVGTAKFNITLADNQQLIVSSYPEDQYARVYNPDRSWSDVSQLEDFTQVNYVKIPSGNSTLLAYLDKKAGISVTFKEERLIV